MRRGTTSTIEPAAVERDPVADHGHRGAIGLSPETTRDLGSPLSFARQDVVFTAMLNGDAARHEPIRAIRLERGVPAVVPAERREVEHLAIVPDRSIRRGLARARRRSSAPRTRSPRRGASPGARAGPNRSISSPISPKSVRDREAGPGGLSGRRSAEPSAFVNCPFVTGFGAVTLTGPLRSVARARRYAPTMSSSPTQLNHCLPLPMRPPRPKLEGRKHPFERATVVRDRTMP